MTGIALEPWSGRGYAVLLGLNTPEQTAFLGGPESEEKLRSRHARYLDSKGDGQMFLVLADGEAVGSVGYWTREWQGREVYETGYGIVAEHHGRGLASAALRLCAAQAAREGGYDWLHAFPKAAHAASNAVCRKARFELMGECDFEYPPGHPIRCNDWRLQLLEPQSPAG